MEGKVQVKESCFVAPSEATPTKELWLTPLDLLQAHVGHMPMMHLYSADNGAAFFDIARLKEALAKALVAFYPLAGRLGVDNGGRIQISCNNEGVLFVVDGSDLTVDDFDFKPSPELRRTFLPLIEPSSIILALQVTLLKCGSVVLGIATHHAAADGFSIFHFLQTWSAMSRDGDGAAVELPCHDRTRLRPRSPPVVHPDAASVLFPKVTFSEPPGPTAAEAFAISKRQVDVLRRRCGRGVSTFCAVSALVWQCVCAARGIPPGTCVRLIFTADVRCKLRPPLPDRYFGNAVVRLGVERDIVASGSSLASVAGRIAGAIDKVDDELVRSAIDYLELAGTDNRPLRKGSISLPETDLRITSWLRLPLYDLDFGSGQPRVMLRAESIFAGSVYLTDDGECGSGAVRMLVCMEAANINKFERLLYANIAERSNL